MKKALLFTMLVPVLVFAFAGTAFAAYDTSFTMSSPIAPGTTVSFNTSWTKAPTDTPPDGDPASPGVQGWVLVTIHDAATGDVVGSSGTWTGPMPGGVEGNEPIRVGADYLDFESYEWFTWSGDSMTSSGLELQFVNAGSYTVDVKLMGDRAWDGSGDELPLQTKTFNVTVGTAPVVSTPASSPWSIALLAVGALGVTLVGRKVRLAK